MSDKVPSLDMSLGELKIIGIAIEPYAHIIGRLTFPKEQKHHLLAVVHHLKARIADFSEGETTSDLFALTFEEIAVIDKALGIFIESVTHLLPASQERNDTLAECHVLHSRVRAAFYTINHE
jgi:hypothetical protein